MRARISALLYLNDDHIKSKTSHCTQHNQIPIQKELEPVQSLHIQTYNIYATILHLESSRIRIVSLRYPLAYSIAVESILHSPHHRRRLDKKSSYILQCICTHTHTHICACMHACPQCNMYGSYKAGKHEQTP